VMNQQKIDEVIIAIPSAPGRVVRLVADVCRRKAVPFRTMPGIYELLGGKVSINRLREVDIADLLQREGSPQLYLCHCTGERATDVLRESLGDVVHRCPAGTVIAFPNADPA